jgi:phenylacetate-CoA ligase
MLPMSIAGSNSMNPHLARGSAVIGRLLFPATNYLLDRPGILSRYRDMLGMEWWSVEDLDRVRRARLVELLEFAGTRVPYYRRLFRKLGFSPSDIRCVADLAQLPELGRDEVKEHYRELIDERWVDVIERTEASGRTPGKPIPLAAFRKSRLIYNTTSGSTGTPTPFFEDGVRGTVNWAHELRLKHWFGLLPGVREARFSRESVGLQTGGWKNRFRRLAWRQMVMPGTNLTDELLGDTVGQLKAFKPLCLMGITSALTSVAQFIHQHGLDIAPCRPQLIIAWAAPLLDHEERILSDVFCCRVTNIYSTREVGHVAMRCPEGAYHVNEESTVVEIEPAENLHEAGEIVVTPLDIVPMPFIRYRVGDVGSLPENRCRCGRTLGLVSKVLGRRGDLVRLSNGRMLSPNFWSHIFRADRLVHSVRRYQVVYKSGDRVLVRIAPGEGFDTAGENYLRVRLKELLGREIHVEVENVSSIAPLRSGKYQTTVNESGV